MAKKNSKAQTQSSKYDVPANVVHAQQSGVATKVSTAKNEGNYLVSFILKTGADAAMSALYLIAAGFKAVESVTAEALAKAVETLEGNWDGREGKAFTTLVNRINAQRKKDGKKPWGNYKTLTRRIKKEIGNGAILNFVPKQGVDEVKAVLGLIK